jgi:hypothetical protein
MINLSHAKYFSMRECLLSLTCLQTHTPHPGLHLCSRFNIYSAYICCLVYTLFIGILFSGIRTLCHVIARDYGDHSRRFLL